MTQSLRLEVVTPQKTLLETEADYVTIPGIIGELGILPGHIPLITNLQSGALKYKNGQNESKIAVHYGYAEVCDDKITILADVAELSEEIDVNRAKQTQQKVEEELKKAMGESDAVDMIAELQKKEQKAITRQTIV